MSWNRLTNAQRNNLVELPVFTTHGDRRLALSYVHPHFENIEAALHAVRSGNPAPPDLGEIVAVARYEDGGWLPYDDFHHWRRPTPQGIEVLGTYELLQWMDTIENNLQQRLDARETRLRQRCREQDDLVANARSEAERRRFDLGEHYRTLVLANLAAGNIEAARRVASRMTPGPSRDMIINLIEASTPHGEPA